MASGTVAARDVPSLPGFLQLNDSVFIHLPPTNSEQDSLLARDRDLSNSTDELPLPHNDQDKPLPVSQSESAPSTSLTLTGTAAGRLSKSKAKDQPDVILLLTWGSAPLRLIAKYSSRYLQLFPSSPIILIRTSFSQMWTHSSSSQSIPLLPVIDALTALFSHIPDPHVLVHVWSNGGAYKLRELAREYKVRRGTILPITKLIFDSAPAKLQVLQGTNATAHAFPKVFLLRQILWGITFLLLAMLKFFSYVRRRHELVTQVWFDVNDRRWIDSRAERAYFFSKEDQVVGVDDVRSHIVRARQLGWSTEVVEFEGSGHVQHALRFGERYWSTVARVWSDGVQQK